MRSSSDREGDKTRKRVKGSKYSREIRGLREELKAEQAKSTEYLNRLKYLQADYENFRKRVEKEFREATQRSNEKLIANLLDIIDDLERAIETGKTTENLAGLSDGVEMVCRNLSTILEREGLTRIETIGKPFDPNVHEVLAKVPTNDHEEGTVVEEARKGFMFKGRVMRPSIVKIACRMERGDEN